MALVIALNRGRILKDCLPLLAKVGIEPAEDVDASRKLIFATQAGDHRLVIMRGSDVPTYVEYGAADIGIIGKDTLLECGSSRGYYERLDLKVGHCRIMTAAPKGAKPVAGPLRVATKFVKVSRDYFERQGRQVSIIPLAGAMEIAPMMNLADCIVDIVDTGNTLKANGLEAGEMIADITTRLIVNRASMKTKFDEVEALVEALRSVVDPS
ncbi:MAG: ATP phosphoribosyltransferase [Pseudomonadales bacterium]